MTYIPRIRVADASFVETCVVLSYYALAIPLGLNAPVLVVVIAVIIVVRLWCFFEQLLDGFRGLRSVSF